MDFLAHLGALVVIGMATQVVITAVVMQILLAVKVLRWWMPELFPRDGDSL